MSGRITPTVGQDVCITTRRGVVAGHVVHATGNLIILNGPDGRRHVSPRHVVAWTHHDRITGACPRCGRRAR